MACPSPWKDIEDKFFECSICLDLFKEPKLLPCLHRFCKQCLESILEGQVGTFKCPLCKDVCNIPNNGIDGFKTDFHMKSMLQFIQLQKTFKNEEERECVGCSKKLKVTAYCFKCKDFLCVQCYQFHLTNKMVADHRENVLALKDVEGKSLTLEKLASLKEALRCYIHTEFKAQLCCCTCGNLPVCVTCTYGKHKGHDLQDVANVSKEERERLQKRLEELVKRKENVTSLTHKINKVNAELTSIVADTKAKWKTQYEDQTRKLKNKKEKEKREFNRFKTVLEERTRKELKELESEMEEKIRKTREDYDRMIKIKIRESNEIEDTKRNEIENRELKIDEKMKKLDAVMNERNKTIEEQQQRKLRETQNLSDLCNQWVNKFENLSTIASSVLESHNHWTDAQCFPDIRAASEPLVEDIMKDFPEMESLSDVTMDDLPMLCIDIVNISDNVESVVAIDVDVMKGNWFFFTGTTSTGSGNIVVSGRLSIDQSFITVINRQGRQICQTKIDQVKGSSFRPSRHCAALSRDKIASVCRSNQVGVYNIQDGSFTQSIITSLFDNIKTVGKKYASCITTDPIRGHIIVGTSIGLLFEFDEELKFIRALKLPEVIKCSRDILYHEGVLLICDEESRCAYAVTMDTSKTEAELLYELPKPAIEGKNWYPWSICADRAGFVYILWCNAGKCIITQYSQDGQQMSTTKRTEDTARFMTTLMTEEGEKLLVATLQSGKMFSYGLTPEKSQSGKHT